MSIGTVDVEGHIANLIAIPLKRPSPGIDDLGRIFQALNTFRAQIGGNRTAYAI
jgi:hypothetical protein